jgi:predicted metal-dependent enzyme (double-stranded beta helix superfamily)
VDNPGRLRDFVLAFTGLADRGAGEERIFTEGRALLAGLVGADDWLPERFAEPDPAHFRQYLLYCDPRGRFSVVSVVWAPGQGTPIHDHTVWGMVGVLRGAERCEEFAVAGAGGPMTAGGTHLLRPGEIDLVSPRVGDIHRVSNACAGQVAVSIHVYGANIGATVRHRYDQDSGAASPFLTGYANAGSPDLPRTR